MMVENMRQAALRGLSQPIDTNQTSASATDKTTMVKVPTPIPNTRELGRAVSKVGAEVGIKVGLVIRIILRPATYTNCFAITQTISTISPQTEQVYIDKM